LQSPQKLSCWQFPGFKDVSRDEVVLNLQPLMRQPRFVDDPRTLKSPLALQNTALGVKRLEGFGQVGKWAIWYASLPDVQERVTIITTDAIEA
jgi:hypothetical protein